MLKLLKLQRFVSQKKKVYFVMFGFFCQAIALKIVEGLRSLGLIVPAKKWAAKLQGTLRTGGFAGFAMKADDQSVWSIESELLEKIIQEGK
jgi:hypothetical protein